MTGPLAGQPHHPNPGRGVDREPVGGDGNLDVRDPARPSGQVLQDPGDRRGSRLIAGQDNPLGLAGRELDP